MKIIAPTSCSNEHYSADCDFVAVDLTQDLAQSILKKLALVNEIKAKDDEVNRIDFYNIEALYFDSEASESFAELDLGDWVKVDSDIKLDEDRAQATEYDRLVFIVMNHGDHIIYFEATPKHCDFTVESPRIPMDWIIESA